MPECVSRADSTTANSRTHRPFIEQRGAGPRPAAAPQAAQPRTTMWFEVQRSSGAPSGGSKNNTAVAGLPVRAEDSEAGRPVRPPQAEGLPHHRERQSPTENIAPLQ